MGFVAALTAEPSSPGRRSRRARRRSRRPWESAETFSEAGEAAAAEAWRRGPIVSRRSSRGRHRFYPKSPRSKKRAVSAIGFIYARLAPTSVYSSRSQMISNAGSLRDEPSHGTLPPKRQMSMGAWCLPKRLHLTVPVRPCRGLRPVGAHRRPTVASDGVTKTRSTPLHLASDRRRGGWHR